MAGERRPDALVVIYNDHVDNYFFDAWSTFAIGVASEYQIADEGWGPRRFGPVPGHRALARHLAVHGRRRFRPDGLRIVWNSTMDFFHRCR